MRYAPSAWLVTVLMLALACSAAAEPPKGADDGEKKREGARPAPAARPGPAPVPSPSRPGPAPTPTLPPPVANSVIETPIVTSCWEDRRYFRSFTAGTVDYCRGHLEYVPGAVDCYSFMEEICSLYAPTSGEWTESRRVLPPDLFACPDDVEPPVCPRFR